MCLYTAGRFFDLKVRSVACAIRCVNSKCFANALDTDYSKIMSMLSNSGANCPEPPCSSNIFGRLVQIRLVVSIWLTTNVGLIYCFFISSFFIMERNDH